MRPIDSSKYYNIDEEGNVVFMSGPIPLTWMQFVNYTKTTSQELDLNWMQEFDFQNDGPPEMPDSIKCKHKDAYLNVVSRALQFWVCPTCKKEVDPPSKKLTQDEIDDLFDDYFGF